RFTKPLFGVQKPYRLPKAVQINQSEHIAVQFSPTSKRLSWEESTSGLISRIIMTARTSIKAALFVFSDQRIVNHLRFMNENHNVGIFTMVEPVFAYQYYSEILDMLGLEMLGPNCDY